MRNVPMKWIYVAYLGVIAASFAYVMMHREPGLGMAGTVVLAAAVIGLATVILTIWIVLRRWKR